MAQELYELICYKEGSEVCKAENSQDIAKEMIIYEESKTTPNNMINFSRPMTTQSNSVESETAFFGFGCFVTKLRNRCNIKCFNVFTDLF